ncbi:MAG: FHA domain-containing protein [Xanthomonadaceae bacterium]|nr:FHA domain-containing protein [Xanthomonadaceae bacterium]
MKSAKKFKTHQVARQKGEKARLKVVSGPDQGTIYVLYGVKAIIGRGEEADVFISDLRASRAHAEIQWNGKGWIATDSNSANGILINGNKLKTSPIQIGDTISLGDTVLEFVSQDASTLLLMSPARNMGQLQLERKTYKEQINRIRSMGTLDGLGEHKQTAILILAGLGFGLFMFLSPNTDLITAEAIKKKAPPTDQKKLAAFLPEIENIDMKKASEKFFREGTREYLMQNYGRAQGLFQTALQVNPGHSQARLYLELCKAAVDEEASKTLMLARRALGLGKIRQSENYFENILKLYQRDQSAPQYVEAWEQLQAIRKPAAKKPEEPGGTAL